MTQMERRCRRGGVQKSVRAVRLCGEEGVGTMDVGGERRR